MRYTHNTLKTHTTTSDFAEIAQAIYEAEHLIFTAGAGMGVDSGLPDFRGNNGFWKAYPMLKEKGGFAHMANPSHFQSNPKVGWGFYGHRLNLYRDTTPHNGFNILRQWAKEKQGNYFIYTSNVDGAFQKAGFSSDKVNECHGSIHHLQPMESRYGARKGTIVSADPYEVIVNENLQAQNPLPRDSQGNLLRPNILMFGDWGWDSSRTDKQYKRMDKWLRNVNLRKTVVIEVGAGTSIPSVRRTSEQFQIQGATLVRINPRESFGGDYCVPLGGLEALEKINEVYSS